MVWMEPASKRPTEMRKGQSVTLWLWLPSRARTDSRNVAALEGKARWSTCHLTVHHGGWPLPTGP